MRWPFFDPPKDEIAAVACDLIVRFGLRSHEEALYLAEVAASMGARKNLQLYRLAAREIEKSFAEARVRLNLRSASEPLRNNGGPRALLSERRVRGEREKPLAAEPRRAAIRH
ncbi:MAG: hypothetical protein ACLQE9_02215 [Roseiarcus sp.]